MQDTLAHIGGQGGVAAVDRQVRVHCPFNSAGMYRGCIVDDAPAVPLIFA